MIYPFANIFVFSWFRLFIRKIEGLENLPKPPFIVVANHESYLDPFFLSSIIVPKVGKKVHFLAMRGRFWNVFGDKISRDWGGCVPLDKDKKKVLQDLKQHLQDGNVVGLFPGGARTLDGNLTKGKTGAARLALEAKVPIVPVGIIGAYDIAPRDKLIPKLKRAELNIGKPMNLKEYYDKKITKEILDEITEKIMLEIAKLTNKKYLYAKNNK